MRTFDFTPLYRSAIGFDRLSDLVEAAASASAQNGNGYPPYNIELIGDDQYRITLAVAGFKEEELDITSHENTLIVTGSKKAEDDSASDKTNTRKFLYQGIAERGFERRYQLADHVKVNSASLENGLLHINLVREIPEELKPKKITIHSGREQDLIEG
ncbi:Hsp20 family protein [Celerinatantimonas diazotrophica]|uniref:Molecular chaperone IbpA n=1 Tax=Celerinatantimonas diazotrophica TaxID=412034 RepID=A0A4R1KF93_9GAMM|nr:Hsp20 family protein [Celerinatantimonas diazotrophica]TCK63355.1 molecular chaperone IbpA [Celerinatantimonas diazotrophica]CAG9294899.1 Small heat shock protein IbpA [Celerinatantimonas diazotrophica]